MNTIELKNKSVLITGANRGIGLALVEKAIEKGASKIYATYRSVNNRHILDDLGDSVIPIQLDLDDSASIEKLAHLVPKLDVLINNAGLFTGIDVLEDSEEQLRNDIETNVFGTLAVTKALVPTLKKQDSAAIINLSSIAGLASMPSFGGYSISKAGVHSLTQSLRGKLKADGISVHGVYPGPVATRLTEGYDMQTTPASVVAENILKGLENGVEDIFPDALSEQVGPVYLSSPKTLEQNFSAF